MSKLASILPTLSTSLSSALSAIGSTIEDFENATTQTNNRASVNDLISGIGGANLNDPKTIESCLNSNPMLKTLNDKNLLLFSSEQRASTLRSLPLTKIYKTAGQCAKDQSLGNIVLTSLNAINNNFSNCSSLGQDFLMTSATMLKDSQAQQKSKVLDSSFEGLSIEAIPSYNSTISYDYNL